MKRRIRNHLSDLLLTAFADPGRREAIRLLARYCSLASRAPRRQVSLAELLADDPKALGATESAPRAALAHLTGEGRLLAVRPVMAGGTPISDGFQGREAQDLLVEPQPDVRAAFDEVCSRVGCYASVLDAGRRPGCVPLAADPLWRGMVEAALCFNAGLFFEAHEHLEQFWRGQPRGPLKRFLQGIIQISVAFHHAREGRYNGAVNLLARGLEKLRGVSGLVLGLDCDDFLPQVARTREALEAGGRAAMRPLPMAEIPRMRITGGNGMSG
jgi:uncharacterized protein